MPPITDPIALEEIKRQQAARMAAMNAPPQAMPFPGAQAPALPRLRTPPSVAKTSEEIPFVRPKAVADIGKTQAETTQTEVQTEKTRGEIAKTQREEGNYARAVDENKLYLKDTLDAIAKARSRITPWSTGWGGLLKDLPGTEAKALAAELAPIHSNTAFNRLQETRNLSPTGGSATGQTSDFEQKMLMNSIANITDQTQSTKQFADHLDEVELHFLRSFAAAEGKPIPNTVEEGRKLFGLPAVSNPPDAPSEKSGSFTHETVEVPPEYQVQENQFLRDHPAGTLTLDQYMAHRADLDKNYNFHTDRDMAAKFVDEYNKGARVTKIPPVIREKPTEGPAAGMAAFANAAAAGIPEAVTGPEGREYFQSLTAQHPGFAWPGEIAGSFVGMKGFDVAGRGTVRGVERLLGKNIVVKGAPKYTKALVQDVGTNAAYGGARGFAGSEEGQGLGGASLGAGLGAGAAIGGQLLTKGVVPFTSKGFQTARGMVDANSLKGFNRENASRALGWIGEKLPKKIQPGTEMNDYVHSRLSAEYNAIKPQISGSSDVQFDNSVAAVKLGARTKEKKEMFKEIANAVGMFKDAKGNYTGEGYVNASERLRFLSKTWRNAQGDLAKNDMAAEAEKVRKQMQLLIQRNAPPELAKRLKAVERGWAHLSRIEGASGAALASNEAMYSPRQYIAEIRKQDVLPRKTASARGKAFDQPYAMAAEKVLGSSGAPKVGLGERFRVISALGGIAAPFSINHYVAGPAIVAIAAGAYGPTAKRIINDVMVGKRVSAIDNQYLRRAFEDVVRHKTSGGD